MKPQPSPSFRFVHPAPRIAVGLAASVTALALTGLVFGRAADERALTFASALRPASVLANAGSPPAATRWPHDQAHAADRVALAAAR